MKTIPKSCILVLEIIVQTRCCSLESLSFLYFFELSEKSGFWKTAIIYFVRGRGVGSRNVDIIIGGGLLNDNA